MAGLMNSFGTDGLEGSAFLALGCVDECDVDLRSRAVRPQRL